MLTYLQRRHLFHGVYIPELVAVLLSASLNQGYGFYVVRDLL